MVLQLLNNILSAEMNLEKAEHCSAFLFDTHCHLLEVNIDWYGKYVNGGLAIVSKYEEWYLLPVLKEKINCSYWYFAIGLHPWFANEEVNWDDFEQALRSDQTLSIGEIGLDGLPNKPDWELQQNIFKKQLKFAYQLDRLVSVHLVKDQGIGFKLIKESAVNRVIIHGFCGSSVQAKQYQNQGWFLGISSRCLSHLNNKTKLMLLSLDRDFFVLESDAPNTCIMDTTPDATYWVAQQLAKLWELDLDFVVRLSNDNWLRLWDRG